MIEALIAGVLGGALATVVAPAISEKLAPMAPYQFVELFLAAALVVGAVEYLLSRWWVRRAVARATLHVRRLAFSMGTLLLEPSGRPLMQVPLDRVRLAERPVSGEWYAVLLLRGRVPPVFYIQAPVASRLAELLAPT